MRCVRQKIAAGRQGSSDSGPSLGLLALASGLRRLQLDFAHTVKSMQPRMIRNPPIMESMEDSSAVGSAPSARAMSGVTGPTALKHRSAQCGAAQCG
jgi:hypothetical protein